MKITLILVAAAVGLCAPAAPLAAPGTVPVSAPVGHASTTPVQHLVVMTQDQHSFDNYFGARPGVDGLPAGVCMPLRSGSSRPCVAPYPIATRTEPTHARLSTTAAAQTKAVNQGRMDGFVAAQASSGSDGSVAMGYYRPQDVPVLTQLADRGVVFDRWFSAVAGGSIPNRLFDVTAQSTADELAVPAAGWGDPTTIFDRLSAAHVPWRVYVENYEPVLTINHASGKARRGGQLARVPILAIPRYVNSPELMSHVADLSQYYADLAAGTLPAVSYVVSTSATEHPPASPDPGQRLARTVVNALIASTAWPSSAFLLKYDSSGGWYDHLVPPKIDGADVGLRVPAVLISPYATPGARDHTVYDSAAVLKFIEQNWTVDPLTPRDRDAANLSAAFAFNGPPRAAALIGVAGERPAVLQPDSATLYFGYGVGLLAAAAAITWAVVGERRRRRPMVGVA